MVRTYLWGMIVFKNLILNINIDDYIDIIIMSVLSVNNIQTLYTLKTFE